MGCVGDFDCKYCTVSFSFFLAYYKILNKQTLFKKTKIKICVSKFQKTLLYNTGKKPPIMTLLWKGSTHKIWLFWTYRWMVNQHNKDMFFYFEKTNIKKLLFIFNSISQSCVTVSNAGCTVNLLFTLLLVIMREFAGVQNSESSDYLCLLSIFVWNMNSTILSHALFLTCILNL